MSGPTPPTGGTDPPTEDETPFPPALVAAWQQGEGQLFGPLLQQPDHYQRAVLLIGAFLQSLRALGPSTVALLTAATTGSQTVAAVAAERQISTAGLDLNLVSMAALAMRHREVVAAQASASRRRRLADARAHGADWVVLEESGDWSGDPFLPYRRLEAHASTGRALRVSADPDDEFRRCQHTVEEFVVDLTSGALRESGGARSTHTDADAREQEVSVRRAQVDRLS